MAAELAQLPFIHRAQSPEARIQFECGISPVPINSLTEAKGRSSGRALEEFDVLSIGLEQLEVNLAACACMLRISRSNLPSS